MRIDSLRVVDAMPVRLFEANALADVIVVAGPNGVGKTRLLARIMQMLRGDAPTNGSAVAVGATGEEERAAWGKSRLDLTVAEDSTLYRSTLQANRRRRNWRSSILQFESNRSIQNLQPLQFSWDMPDPAEEEMGWDYGFNYWASRWQDTVHSMFRLIEFQKQSIANRAVQLRRDGHDEMKLAFNDPMAPFKDVFAQLLAPKELVDPTARRQTLEFKTTEGQFDISELSSGEREVINIAFDFLLRRPSDCIVFFDEPELHLHPELSHRLIQVLQGIGERNQFVLSTHSPDVISASLDKSVIFVSPARQIEGVPANQAITVSEDDETNQALKLLGHSIGIVALGKKIVLVEGTTSSLDKEVYGSLTRGRFPDLVLVPSGGKHVIESFEAVHQAVLSKSMWGVEFFMLCDRDSVPSGGPLDASSERFRVLSRYHLENYFLDEFVLADAFANLEPANSWLRDPAQVRAKLKEIASEYVSYAVALAVAAQVRLDAGNVSVMPKECHGLNLAGISALLTARATSEGTRLETVLNAERVSALASEHFSLLEESLRLDDDRWTISLPGKPVLARFAGHAGLQISRLKSMYINAATISERDPFKDVVATFQHFSSV